MNPDFPVGRYHEDLSAFAKRRASLLTQLEAAGGGALLLPTAPERIRNGGTAAIARSASACRAAARRWTCW